MGNDFVNICVCMFLFIIFDVWYVVCVSVWEFVVIGINLVDCKYYLQVYDCSGGVVLGIYLEDGWVVKFIVCYDF